MAGFNLRHSFGGARGNNSAAPITAFRADINDPIRGLDHVEIVLDYDDSIALILQLKQHYQELTHVFEVQPRCRLVQDIECAVG